MHDLFEHSPTATLLLTRPGVVVAANTMARRIGFMVGQTLDATRGDVAELVRSARDLPAGDEITVALDVERGEASLDRARIMARPSEAVTDGAELVLFLRIQSPEEAAGRLIRRMVAHTTGAGQTYFEQLAVHLSSKLGTRWAMVGVTLPGGRSVRSLAFCRDGELLDNFEYELTGTPCEGVLADGPCYYPAHARDLFPDDDMLMENGIEAYVGVPLVGRQGHPVGLLVLMHDAPIEDPENSMGFLSLFAGRTATEIDRLRAEQEASRQRAFAEQLLDRVGALVLLLEPDGTVLRANRTVEGVTGWSEERLRGQALWETIAPPEARTELQELLRGARDLAEQDWRTLGGETRRVRWEAETVADPDASRTYVLVTGVDTTALESARRERDRLQERLRQARRLEALGRLAGGVAHDFNNLLLAILGYADLIEMETEGTETASFAREIRRAGDQAAALTRQLLAFGRRQRLDRRQLDLGEVVDSASRILKPLLSDAIELDVVLPDVALPVVADPGRLETVVVNLGINARDAMPDGGRLSIHARVLPPGELPDGADDQHVVSIEVRDTGTGIPQDVLPHIFEPFFTTKELGRGTGLGLASVYGTVQQHGGTVDVHTSAGEGTTFRILLPLADLFGDPASGHRPQEALPEQRGYVLVAEDDPQVRDLVQRVLTDAGYSVEAFEDGEKALQAWEARPGAYDLIMADVLMPRLGGVELCHRVLALDPGASIVLTSGFVAESDRVPDGVRLLQKPYLPDDLLQEVARAMGNPLSSGA